MTSIVDEVRASVRILQKFEGTSHHEKMSTTHANRLKSVIEAEDFTARDLEAMLDLLAGSKFLEADQCSVMDALATNSTTTTSPKASPPRHNATQQFESCYLVLTEQAWYMLKLGDFSEMFAILTDLGLVKPSEKTLKAMTVAWQIAAYGIEQTRLKDRDSMRAAVAFMKKTWQTHRQMCPPIQNMILTYPDNVNQLRHEYPKEFQAAFDDKGKTIGQMPFEHCEIEALLKASRIRKLANSNGSSPSNPGSELAVRRHEHIGGAFSMEQCAMMMVQCMQAIAGSPASRPRVAEESPIRDLSIYPVQHTTSHDSGLTNGTEDFEMDTDDLSTNDCVPTLAELRDDERAKKTVAKKRPAASDASEHMMKKPAMASGKVVPPRPGYVQVSRDAGCDLPAGWTIWMKPPRNDKYYMDPATNLMFKSMVEVRRFLKSA